MKTEKKATVLKTVEEARAYLMKLSVKAKAVEKRLEKSIPEGDDIDLGNPDVDDPEQFDKEMEKFDKGIEKFGRQFDKAIASLAGALIYFISPVDLIPDWIPMAGFLDDAAILAAVFKLSEADLKFYRRWKRKQQPEDESEVAMYGPPVLFKE